MWQIMVLEMKLGMRQVRHRPQTAGQKKGRYCSPNRTTNCWNFFSIAVYTHAVCGWVPDPLICFLWHGEVLEQSTRSCSRPYSASEYHFLAGPPYFVAGSRFIPHRSSTSEQWVIEADFIQIGSRLVGSGIRARILSGYGFRWFRTQSVTKL